MKFLTVFRNKSESAAKPFNLVILQPPLYDCRILSMLKIVEWNQ